VLGRWLCRQSGGVGAVRARDIRPLCRACVKSRHTTTVDRHVVLSRCHVDRAGPRCKMARTGGRTVGGAESALVSVAGSFGSSVYSTTTSDMSIQLATAERPDVRLYAICSECTLKCLHALSMSATADMVALNSFAWCSNVMVT
jgi:hypothetical protein